jgi:hypothetical protein
MSIKSFLFFYTLTKINMSIHLPPGKRKRKISFSRFASLAAVAILSTLTLVAGGFYLLNNNENNVAMADSAGSLTLGPGETGRFFLRYGNASPDTALKDVLLNVRIGKSLEINTATLFQLNENQTKSLTAEQVRQQFASITKYPININYQSGNDRILSSSNTFSSIIKYTPGSANNQTSPSGNIDKRDLATETFGYVTFEATVRSDVFSLINPNTGQNYIPGDELSPLDQEGVLSFLTSSNDRNQSIGRYAVVLKEGSSLQVSSTNIGNEGFCSPASQVTGVDLNYCAFPLVKNGQPITSNQNPTLPAGGIIANVDTAQGDGQVCSIVSATEVNKTGPQLWLKCQNIPLNNALPRGQGVNLEFPNGQIANDKATIEVLPEGEPKVIAHNNIGQVLCNPSTQTIGENISFCAFQLLDDGAFVNNPDGLEIPEGGLNSSIDTATGKSNNCQIVSYQSIYTILYPNSTTTPNNQGYWLKCDNVPTNNGQVGTQKVKLNFPDNTIVNDKGFVNLINEETKIGCLDRNLACRLYFIGKDGGQVNWNEKVRFNVDSQNGGWPRTQTFKQGTATVVFDEIKTSDNQYITNGSVCTFEFYRYTMTSLLRTKTSTAQNGKCQVELPVTDQGVNYYRVVVNAVDTQKNETMNAIDTLVLAVGG